MTLSVLILAKNEEKNIAECITSALFADEIIVIDDDSSDETAAIAQYLGAKVCRHAMNGDWGAQQTFAIQQATSDWIFFLDADERFTAELVDETKQAVKAGELFAYKVPRLNYFIGQEVRHCGWYPDYGEHLVPRANFRVEGFVHPTFIHNYPPRYFKNHMIHYPYRSWEQYFNKFNNYTNLAAKKMYSKGKRANFFFDILIRPYFAFFKMYILKSGWKDGRLGFVLSAFHFFYTMAKYVKLYWLVRQMEAEG
jgi:glycosyltransferase involved in cell wall biosynthesis